MTTEPPTTQEGRTPANTLLLIAHRPGRQHSHRVLVTAEEEARLVRLAAAGRVTVPRLLVEPALAGWGRR